MNDCEAYQLALERQQMVLDALMRCKEAGADDEALQTLATEMGLAREWQQEARSTRT